MADSTVVFDLSPRSSGAYYVAGQYVMHKRQVCVVATTVRLDGTRYRAVLHPELRPTLAQRREAEEWLRDNPSAR